VITEQNLLVAPDYATDEIDEIARKLRKEAGFEDDELHRAA
jgi:hypothetical protein